MPRIRAVARSLTPAPKRPSPSRSGRHLAHGRRRRVIVVDDHDDLRAIFSEVLERAGWSVRAFGRAEDALRAVAEDPPDVVLTDINLDGLSGRGLARALRVDPRTEDMPIVAASGSVAPSPALLRAFDRFLVKPVDLTTLSATLLDVLDEVDDRAG